MKDPKAFGEKLGYIFATSIICCFWALMIAATLKLLFLIF